MAKSGSARDQFAQLAYIDNLQSAVNTIHFAGLSVFSNILSNQGMVIHRIQHFVSINSWLDLDADNRSIRVALVGDDSMTSLAQDDPRVYDFRLILRQDSAGAAANFVITKSPLDIDYSMLPGGGLLVPADRLWTGIESANLTIAAQVQTRIWFTLRTLSAQDYLELAQAMRVLR